MQQDEYGLYDIYTFIHVPFWKTVYFKSVILFIVGMCLLFGLWKLLRYLMFSKRHKSLSTKQKVLSILGAINKEQGIQSLYTSLSDVIRLFFTDTHGKDMESLTEHEIIKHIDDCQLCNMYNQTGFIDHCVVCKTNYLLLCNWKKEVKQLLEKISNVKYKEAEMVRGEVVTNDINIVIVLVHSVYFKK